MNNKTKTTLQFILATMLFTSFTIAGCNNSGDAKEAAKDSPAVTEKGMEAAPATPAVPDTLKKDTASTRPTPGGS